MERPHKSETALLQLATTDFRMASTTQLFEAPRIQKGHELNMLSVERGFRMATCDGMRDFSPDWVILMLEE